MRERGLSVQMKNKITLQADNEKSIEEQFERYIRDCTGRGLSEKTIATYTQHFKSMRRFLDMEKPLRQLSREDMDNMTARMRNSGLARNSVASYVRTFKAFLSWANKEDITEVNIPLYKEEETIKETYTDEELKILLVKPNIKECDFQEYRDWVIINFLLNSGCRAGSIRSIQNRDVDLENSVVYLRHTKNKRVQIIPLCSIMRDILREYMRKRKGEGEDYLFCTEYGEQFTEAGLGSAIARYNQRRGIKKTSIHLFRHTFARKYLVDCGGNAFTLQKLLGHSTLEMTKHYCAIFNKDIVREYDSFSPLSQMAHKKMKL